MPLDLPARPGCIVNSTFGLETNTQSFTSPLTKNVQRALLGGSRWRMSMTLRRMHKSEAAAAEWMAFFLQCEGMVNTFNAYDPDRQTPRGSGLGTPLVQGAGQTGSQLLIDGLVAHDVPLKIGDYFGVNGQLVQVIYGQTPGSDVIADVSGQAYVNFKPALRSSPADNAPLTFFTPTCTMILADDSQAMWECDRNGVYQEKTFTAFEVFS